MLETDDQIGVRVRAHEHGIGKLLREMDQVQDDLKVQVAVTASLPSSIQRAPKKDLGLVKSVRLRFQRYLAWFHRHRTEPEVDVQMLAAVADLTSLQKHCVGLYTSGECNLDEIARRLNIPREVVHRQLAKAYAELRARQDEAEQEACD